MPNTATTPILPAVPPAEPGPPSRSLAHLPVTLFASVMGLGGLSLAWRRAAKVWDVPQWPAVTLLAVATSVFLVVGVLYTLKWARHPAVARAELRHPVRMTFAPTVTVSVLVLATAGQDVAPALASTLWWIGTVGHLAATVAVLSAWFSRTDIGPGLLQRVLLHDPPLPSKLLPTIAIFIAPPAVAMLSWQALTGVADGPVVRILYAAAMVFVALLMAQVPRLRRLPFALPAWAYTFPLAAASAAAISMAAARQQPTYDVVAVLLLTGTTTLVLTVAALTVRAAARHQICVPE